jgi:hypothetical protein
MKTITSVLAVSVFVSFFVWISALAVADRSVLGLYGSQYHPPSAPPTR